MYHDPALAATANERPRSAVSIGAGMAGLVGFIVWIGVARSLGMDGPFSALVNLVAVALPMVVWSLGVDKVHRHASTGIDWSAARPWRETLEVSLVKLAGYWITWAAIALVYGIGRFYWEDPYRFAMGCFLYAAPVVVMLSVPYVLWLDRRLVEPRDGAWAFGAWLLGIGKPDKDAVANHLRTWAVKGFFLAFMLAVVPGGFADFVNTDTFGIVTDPVRLSNWLIAFMFTVDCAFATVGYVLTLRPLDAHIRSANPFAAAWTAALICYPPFQLMEDGGPLDYHTGTQDWSVWFQWHPLMLWAVGLTLVALAAFYAWATVAFGLRFSNLTNRGILTHGPYAISRHPAYLAKNLFWWLTTVPILTTGSVVDAVRACALMAAVSGVYYWRAKTEERHLKLDPDYVAYDAWIAHHGLVPRLFGRITGR